MAAAALRVTLVISRPSQVTWCERGRGEPVALLPGGRRTAFESTNHTILVTSIFFCVFRRVCIVGIFFLSCFLKVFIFVVEIRHLLQCLKLICK